jgi:hypothetical protein
MKAQCDSCHDWFTLSKDDEALINEGLLETIICYNCELYEEMRPDDSCACMSNSDADCGL